MLFLQFLNGDGRSGSRTPAPLRDMDPSIVWLQVSLNTRLSHELSTYDRYHFVQRSLLTFGNSLFMQDVSELDRPDMLFKSIRQLLARIAPGVVLLSVAKKDNKTDPDFELKFEMRVDLRKLGGPGEATVGALFSVSGQRAELSSS